MDLQQTLDYARHYGLTDRELADVVRTAAEARRAADAAGLVTLVHPGLDGRVIHVPPEAVEAHEASGWQAESLAEPEPEPESKPAGRRAQKEN